MPHPAALLCHLADVILGPIARAAIIKADLDAMIAQGRALPIAVLEQAGAGR